MPRHDANLRTLNTLVREFAPQLLFVYGTLHPNRAPSEILDAVNQLTLVGPATIQGTLHDLGPYPALTLTGDQVIPGTLFALPEDPTILVALDAYEDYRHDTPEASLFLRTRSTATLPNDSHASCWVYLYNQHLPRAN